MQAEDFHRSMMRRWAGHFLLLWGGGVRRKEVIHPLIFPFKYIFTFACSSLIIDRWHDALCENWKKRLRFWQDGTKIPIRTLKIRRNFFCRQHNFLQDCKISIKGGAEQIWPHLASLGSIAEQPDLDSKLQSCLCQRFQSESLITCSCVELSDWRSLIWRRPEVTANQIVLMKPSEVLHELRRKLVCLPFFCLRLRPSDGPTAKSMLCRISLRVKIQWSEEKGSTLPYVIRLKSWLMQSHPHLACPPPFPRCDQTSRAMKVVRRRHTLIGSTTLHSLRHLHLFAKLSRHDLE